MLVRLNEHLEEAEKEDAERPTPTVPGGSLRSSEASSRLTVLVPGISVHQSLTPSATLRHIAVSGDLLI